MRFAPRASNCSTNARPSPRFAPVTTATEPSILMAVSFQELPVVLCRRGRRTTEQKDKTDSSVYYLPQKKRGVTRPSHYPPVSRQRHEPPRRHPPFLSPH